MRRKNWEIPCLILRMAHPDGNMRYNGTIQFEQTSTGGINEYGEPIPAKTEWGEPIKCSIKANSDTRKGIYEDGKFRQASYVVLIETRTLPGGIQRTRLKRFTENLGEHDILNIEPLLSVGRIQILV